MDMNITRYNVDGNVAAVDILVYVQDVSTGHIWMDKKAPVKVSFIRDLHRVFVPTNIGGRMPAIAQHCTLQTEQ